MTIPLEVLPELEARLREKAAERDVEALRLLLVEAIEPAIEDLIRERSSTKLNDEEFEVCADQLAEEWAAAAAPEALPLPDEAVTRAGIYRDHP